MLDRCLYEFSKCSIYRGSLGKSKDKTALPVSWLTLFECQDSNLKGPFGVGDQFMIFSFFFSGTNLWFYYTSTIYWFDFSSTKKEKRKLFVIVCTEFDLLICSLECYILSAWYLPSWLKISSILLKQIPCLNHIL